MDHALTALNRFGLGARIGERGGLSDPRGWLRQQLRPEAALLERADVPTDEVVDGAARALLRAQRTGDREGVRTARRTLQEGLAAERGAALTARVVTDTPYVERLVAFWSNHLCVSVAGNQRVVPHAGAYERDVIRPHVLGSFTDMVLASARHPAMLLYLDNVRSTGPGSPLAREAERRGRREPGLNENYARELLELHTLGVDGGYGQADVEALARVLTGWTLAGLGPAAGDGPRRFAFRPALHEPGAKTVLGRRYGPRPGPDGVREGEEVIRDLCSHPATARFVAGKLVRHFVADDPPAAATARIERVFLDTEGDLAEVSRALVDLDEAWDPRHRKVRAPQDWVVAALRAVHAREAPPALVGILGQLRHALWAPDAPKGFGDGVRDWADPDGLMSRAELARTIAERVAGSGMDPVRLLEVIDLAPDDPLRGLAADGSVPAGERVALVLAGPAFQWR